MEKLEKKELQKVFWRSFTLLGSMNYERMQGLGFAYSLMPALKKIYKEDKSGLAQALERHMAVFNTAVAPATFIMGVSLAMEEEKQMNPDFDASSINTVKAALMGPLAGIGDAFFWGVFRIVA
ncbi:PTS system mannose/fructose/sorbose family transporter subunit IID, partial [Enterococcus sp. HMSC05C03]